MAPVYETTESVYTNKYYYVIVLDDPIINHDEPHMPPLNYGIYNRETEVMESYHTYQVAAIQTAEGLAEALEEVLTPMENVVEFNPECTH